ncbi:uncharacterized protein AB675_4511 [Cyphellophora attinorum]|uniref:Uncharacterized protein n=1 Tax=Cyphellophora attinorum TaxID=1664694 RepID=A0A0N1H9U7_9EURO|nr:uncharacterized protein AB675_4511 [Phialophora attinorum]KPI39090.1 hypothetical protein AB675_4511 [Phialophora attinorum]
MPSHLHPRSTATSTLFAGTLLASFVVISIPHIFPCPRPRTQYMDADSQLRRAEDMAAASSPPVQAGIKQQGGKKTVKRSMEAEAAVLKMLEEEARKFEKEARILSTKIMPTTLLTLPLEIRQMIWKFTMTGTIDVLGHCQHAQYPPQQDFDTPILRFNPSSLRNPRLPLLLACKVISQDIVDLPDDYIFSFCHARYQEDVLSALLKHPAWTPTAVFARLQNMRCCIYITFDEWLLIKELGLGKRAMESVVDNVRDEGDNYFLPELVLLVKHFVVEIKLLDLHKFMQHVRNFGEGWISMDIRLKELKPED